MSKDRLTQTKRYQECITACFACAQTCETCSDDMIGMDHHGDQKLMAKCIRLCRECADICVLAGRWMSQGSAMSDRLCGLCADICDSYAEVCEQHAPHHALCGMSSLRRTVSKNDTCGGLAVEARSHHETRNDRVDGIVGGFSPGSYRQRYGDESVHPARVRPDRSFAAETGTAFTVTRAH